MFKNFSKIKKTLVKHKKIVALVLTLITLMVWIRVPTLDIYESNGLIVDVTFPVAENQDDYFVCQAFGDAYFSSSVDSGFIHTVSFGENSGTYPTITETYDNYSTQHFAPIAKGSKDLQYITFTLVVTGYLYNDYEGIYARVEVEVTKKFTLFENNTLDTNIPADTTAPPIFHFDQIEYQPQEPFVFPRIPAFELPIVLFTLILFTIRRSRKEESD